MPENILVVEYEPRYTDRVKQALNGQPFQPLFAKDGEEALSNLDQGAPRLIVLSSVIPKISAPELIRMIRNRADFKSTPILMTISGYSGKSPKSDAMKLGASDILPKPYSEGEFLGKVRQLLAAQPETTVALNLAELGSITAKPVPPPSGDGATLTSDDIFGDLVDDDKTPAAAKRPASKSSQDLDEILAQTLSGVRPVKKKPAEERPATPAAPSAAKEAQTAAKAKASQDLDDFLHNTLSGLEKKTARPATQVVPPKPVTPPQSEPAVAKPVAVAPPAATPAPAASAAAVAEPVVAKPVAVPPRPQAASVVPAPMPPTVGVSAPVLAPKPEPEHHEEEEEHGEGIRFGQYVLLEKIATGGMAEVWKARMRGVEGFQKIVAIKKILPHMSDNEEFVTMFIDEAKLAAQLNHNNIIHIYDLGKIANSYYIAMEFIDGRDLKTILKRGEEQMQPVNVELALFIASKIASALDYAHRKRDFDEKEMGLVHRDVSPQNVLISYEGDIKLCDFGIAKAASKASHTMAGALKGKLQYMSPEQAWGKSIDKRSDVFALAAVLFEMLTGRKLFTGDSELSVLEQVREARVQLPSQINDEVTPEIDRIVQKALQKEPSARYQTAGEMARDLDAVLYSFRPTPTSADLAIFMHRLYGGADEQPVVAAAEASAAEPAPVVQEKPAPVVAAPVVVPASMPSAPAPVVAPPAAGPRVSEVPSFGTAVLEEKKKAPIVPIAIAAAVILAIIGGIYFATRKSATPATAAPAARTQVAATTTSTAAQPLVPAGTQTLPVTATTATGLGQGDEALVNEEVKRRLAEEKARLEKSGQAAAPAATATQAAAPAPAVQTPAPAPVAPPVAQPVAQQPTATVAEQREEPRAQPPAPAPAAVKEGDLVETGAEGLQPPQLVNLRKPSYPQMARLQRVEGIVVLRALISETGRVLDVTILRGVPQKVGINEAAAEAIRGSQFRPATKDGVRVKSYYTMTIPFKL